MTFETDFLEEAHDLAAALSCGMKEPRRWRGQIGRWRPISAVVAVLRGA